MIATTGKRTTLPRQPDTRRSGPPLAGLFRDRAERTGRRPFFYGWMMLAATIPTTAATSPGQSFVIGVFSDAIRADLGISLPAFSGAYLIATLCASLPLTLVGRIGDRRGTRIVMGGVGLLLELACGFVGAATALARDLAPSGIAGDLLVLVTLTVAFFLLRFLGQGALGLVSAHALALWFERRLGLVESFRHLGMPLAVAVLPVILLSLIDALGWRYAYAALGLCVWVIVLPLAWLVHADDPAQVGQRVDHEPDDHERDDRGRSEPVAPGARVIAPIEFTLDQSLRTRAYWIVTASMVLSAAVGTAFVFHAQPMLSDLGLTRRAAAAVVGTLGIVTLVMTVPFGFLVDRIRPRYLLAATGFLLAGACGCYAGTHHLAAGGHLQTERAALVIHAAYVLLALSQGLLFVMVSPVLARFFGRRHHGAIRGNLTTFMVIGTAAGPYLFAQWREFTGSFVAAYVAAGAVGCILAIWALRLDRPGAPGPARPTSRS